MNANTNPLIVFLHIPKTAGSSVNYYLNEMSPFGAGHIEGNLNHDYGNLDWVSGHLTRVDMETSLSLTSRKIDWYAAMRDPISQLCSALNWQFIVLKKGSDFFSGHLEHQKQFILEVSSIDFANENAILNLLIKHRHSLFGNQTTFLNHRSASKIVSKDEMEEIVGSYTFIAHESSLIELYKSFQFVQYCPLISPVENKSPYHFDLGIFKTGILYEYIMEMNETDERMYSLVKKNFNKPIKHHPIRASLTIANEINYNEAAYLAANPDVELAVQKGAFDSGRSHFAQNGFSEGRLMKFSPDPRLGDFGKSSFAHSKPRLFRNWFNRK
jgi:hypothetical protein